MSELNTISLNPDLKEALYKKHLYQIDVEKKHNRREKPSIPMQGNMQKKILWLVRNKKTAEMQETEQLLMHKILHACKLVPDDIGLVQLNNMDVPVEKIIHTFQPEIVFLSGLTESETSELGTTLYEVRDSGSIQMIQTDALEVMGADQLLRAKFWNALRQLFNL